MEGTVQTSMANMSAHALLGGLKATVKLVSLQNVI